jgi:hypothetical protein
MGGLKKSNYIRYAFIDIVDWWKRNYVFDPKGIDRILK